MEEADNSTVKYRLLSSEGKIPKRGSPCAAGYDIFSAENCVVHPHTTVKIKTDLSINIPSNTYCRIADRSSLAYNYNLHVLAGVIDPDFQGNIQVVLHNLGAYPIYIYKNHSIAQIIFEKFLNVEFEKESEEPSPTKRGINGFGSSNYNHN